MATICSPSYWLPKPSNNRRIASAGSDAGGCTQLAARSRRETSTTGVCKTSTTVEVEFLVVVQRHVMESKIQISGIIGSPPLWSECCRAVPNCIQAGNFGRILAFNAIRRDFRKNSENGRRLVQLFCAAGRIGSERLVESRVKRKGKKTAAWAEIRFTFRPIFADTSRSALFQRPPS